MAAYRDGTLALDQLTAFCVSEDVERQRQVFAQMGQHMPVYAIRRAMTEAKVSVGDRRFALTVTPDAAPEVSLAALATRRADGRLAQGFSARDDNGVAAGTARVAPKSSSTSRPGPP